MTASSRVWLSGERYDLAYLFDTDTGVAEQFDMHGEAMPLTGCRGVRARGGFVAIYSSSDRRQVVLQFNREKIPLDGSVRVEHRLARSGASSKIRVIRHGAQDLVIKAWTWGILRGRLTDPLWDGLDEAGQEPFGGIANLAASAELRHSYLKQWDPSAGPWHLIE